MKKSILTLAVCALPMLASAQYSFDALQLSQFELRGTSRFMSMGGAFGALGGDISTLNQNPAGIGVYRSSDLGLTLGFDMNSAKAGDTKVDMTKFSFNNVGYVGTAKLDSEIMPLLNWGVSYNRNYSYNRHWRGAAYGIPTSMTNYLSDLANAKKLTVSDLDPVSGSAFDGLGGWNQVLAYQNYLMLPNAAGNHFDGLGFNGVVGAAEFEVEEKGHNDEFTLTLGGNLANTMYWGLGVGIIDLLYEYNRYYGEVLENTVVYNKPNDATASLVDGDASFGFSDWSRTTGTGYNFKFGVILKPVNAFRVGVAFHTPTYYKMKDTYQSVVATDFYTDKGNYSLDDAYTPTASSWYKLRTPWRFIGSLATVMGSKGILSADYEYVGNTNIRLLDDYGHEFAGSSQEMKDFLAGSHIVRVGGEWRVTPNWSLRAGFSHQTSNASQDVRDYGGARNADGSVYPVQVGGNNTAYAYDRSVQHITAGIGYHHKNVYFDMAYVHKNRQGTYEAFPIDNDGKNVRWDVSEHDNKITATLGFRF
ncbi:MAG: hypothetical protein IJT30_06165 [Muribaculaceae bacterium]|nr:hypothetical protein [Muribaculaceae bacterium]